MNWGILKQPGMGTRSRKPYTVLLVEDNPGDVRLMREALQQVEVVREISTVADGEQATAYLKRQEPYAQAVRPDLIFLDLNLPRKDGRQVLTELKSDPELRRIPVAVLTTSAAQADVDAVYSLQANCYIRKPIDLDRFLEVVRLTAEFWFSVAELPDRVAAEQASAT
jgi:two-component system, chemotaxis family, response regulator Rcp1